MTKAQEDWEIRELDFTAELGGSEREEIVLRLSGSADISTRRLQ
jgi:hypothetical protein